MYFRHKINFEFLKFTFFFFNLILVNKKRSFVSFSQYIKLLACKSNSHRTNQLYFDKSKIFRTANEIHAII